MSSQCDELTPALKRVSTEAADTMLALAREIGLYQAERLLGDACVVLCIHRNGGNIAAAARELGMKRQTLYERIRVREL